LVSFGETWHQGFNTPESGTYTVDLDILADLDRHIWNEPRQVSVIYFVEFIGIDCTTSSPDYILSAIVERSLSSPEIVTSHNFLAFGTFDLSMWAPGTCPRFNSQLALTIPGMHTNQRLATLYQLTMFFFLPFFPEKHLNHTSTPLYSTYSMRMSAILPRTSNRTLIPRSIDRIAYTFPPFTIVVG
jgi:hypothetical protein